MSSAATSTTATKAASSPTQPPAPTRSRCRSPDPRNPATRNPATSPPSRTADPIGPRHVPVELLTGVLPREVGAGRVVLSGVDPGRTSGSGVELPSTHPDPGGPRA